MRRAKRPVPPPAPVSAQSEILGELPDVVLHPACSEVRIYFDGGARESASSAIVLTDELGNVIYHTGVRLVGVSNSHRAEANALRLANILCAKLLLRNSSLAKVKIFGDNHAVVLAAACRLESVRAIPGRSACRETWAAVAAARAELDKALQQSNGASVDYVWVPRRFNAFADEVATATILRRAVSFDGLSLTPPPVVYKNPTLDELRRIANDALVTPPDSVRSIPPALAPLWRQVLSVVVSWGMPAAVLLAPRVLLRKDGDLRAKLSRLANAPAEAQKYFFNAANGSLLHALRSAKPDRPNHELDWALLEKLAVAAPSRCLKRLRAATVVNDEDPAAHDFLLRLTSPASDLQFPDVVASTPLWHNINSILSVIGSSLSRLAAPSLDGWTRELLLPSVDRGNAQAFEGLVNDVVRGSADEVVKFVLRAVRLAVWRKPDSSSYRVIGMTSPIAKVCWKLAVGDHLKTHSAPRNAACAPGGAVSAVRRAQDALHRGEKLWMVDVVDAFWNASRDRLFSILRGSPLLHLFSQIYGSPNTLVHGKRVYSQRDGVLPGCGGAAFLFMLDLDARLSPVPAHLRCSIDPFMDDIAAYSVQAFDEVCAVLGSHCLSKARLVDPSASIDAPIRRNSLDVSVVRATRYLGAFVGDVALAAAMLHTKVDSTAALIDKMISTPLLCQTKWQLLRVILLSLEWLAVSTEPKIFNSVAERIDNIVFDVISRAFLLDGTALDHNASLLIHTPLAAGGLGIVSFGQDSSMLFDIATASSRSTSVEQRLTVTVIKKQMQETLMQRLVDLSTFKPAGIDARCDSSHPWFGIQPVTKATRITDDAWRLAMSNFLALDVPYPVCFEFDPTSETARDHSNTCHRCAGPFRYARHQRLVSDFLSVSSKHGVIATANFDGVYGVMKKKPDIIVFRVDETSAASNLLLDITVPHQAAKHSYNASTAARNYKLHKYRDYCDPVDPFVITTIATMEEKTNRMLTKFVDGMKIRKSYLRDLVARLKTAVIRFEGYRIKALSAKKNRGDWNPVEAEE